MALKTAFSTAFVKDKNFWEIPHHQDLLALKCFKTLHDSDGTSNKEVSGKIMWAIYFIYDLESKYILWELSKRITYIENEYLEEPNYFTKISSAEKKLIQECIKQYESLQTTSVKRQLIDFDIKLDERRTFMNRSTYNEATWEMLDKMQKETLNFAKQRKAIEDLVVIEEARETKKGGKLSLFAEGKLNTSYESMYNGYNQKEDLGDSSIQETRISEGTDKKTTRTYNKKAK